MIKIVKANKLDFQKSEALKNIHLPPGGELVKHVL